MSITAFAIEHLSDFYDFANKKTVKNLVKENIGRFVKYDDTNDFLTNNTIVGIEKFSRKEQNLLADTLKDNPFNTMIIEHYNNSIQGLEIADKTDFIKRIKTLSEFLKAVPYSEPGFQFKAYQKVIDWAINNESGNFDILLKGFNNYVESSVLNSLFSDDLVDSKRAIEDITERVTVKQELEKKEVVTTGVASVISVGLAGFLGGGAEMAEAVIPKITGIVGTTAFAPTMLSVAHVAIGAFAFYKTFQIINGVTDEIKEKSEKKKISGMSTEYASSLDNVKDFLRDEMFREILTIPQYDMSKKENQKYLDLILFANEKLSDVGRRISGELIAKHNLTHNEVILMNSLDYERVHEVANVKHPDIRQWMLLGKVDPSQEFFYKSVSNAMFLMGHKNKESVSLDNPKINNMDVELKTWIDILPDSTKRMVNCYLAVTVKEDGICPKTDMKNVLEAVSKYADNEILLASILTENLQTKMKHFDKVEIKNKELNYFKRVAKFIVGSDEEKLTRNNAEIRSYILSESDKYGYEATDKVVRKNPGFVEKLSTTAVNVLYKIGGIREKLKDTLSIGSNLRPQG